MYGLSVGLSVGLVQMVVQMIPFGLCTSDYARRISSSDGRKSFFPLIFFQTIQLIP